MTETNSMSLIAYNMQINGFHNCTINVNKEKNLFSLSDNDGNVLQLVERRDKSIICLKEK